eukprot:TRINITY_DN10872_c0_g1_i1.p1 TRINITY_DN10872_c0_g1~~TRINITY_DN10872_c0_g1_i1.p1  ORF type:complete len:211 (-),score=38.40 TRINITY_DN10872_c0_g1_i1:56-688(-)
MSGYPGMPPTDPSSLRTFVGITQQPWQQPQNRTPTHQPQISVRSPTLPSNVRPGTLNPVTSNMPTNTTRGPLRPNGAPMGNLAPNRTTMDIDNSMTSRQTESQIVSRHKLKQLCYQIDPQKTLDAEAEDLLMVISDNFIEEATNWGCMYAKHREGKTLEVQDLKMYLEKKHGMQIPGFENPSEQVKRSQKRLNHSDIHQKRMADIKRAKK